MANDFTLDDLLNGLTKSAADTQEEEKGEGKDEGKSTEGKKDEKAEGKEGKAEGEQGEGQEKSAAFAAGSELAKQVFEKVAQYKENEMNKQASIAGQALADAILTKLASVGDANTENGIGAAVPNKTQQDLAAQVAEDDAKVKGMPGAGGSMNEIFDSIVADAQSQGAAAYDSVAHVTPSQVEGDPGQTATPNQVDVEDQQEKVAAMLTLMDQGFDFDSAVSMVKQAEEALAIEADGQIKQAAVGELMAQGFDFDDAVALVKEASLSDTIKDKAQNAKSGLVRSYAGAKSAGKAFISGKLDGAGKDIPAGIVRSSAAKTLMKNRLVQGIAAGAALGAGGAAYAHHQKKAAFDMLVDAGVDFEKAAELVASKAAELYGI